MAATFEFCEHHGAGPTLVAAVTQVNWKSVGDVATSYLDAPIVAGANSFEKYQFGRFASGGYTTLLNGRFAHTAGALPTGATLFGPPTMTASGDQKAYATPVATTSSKATAAMSDIIGIAQGVAVWFGITGPAGATKTATIASPSAYVYTNYLVTQLRTASSIVAGEGGPITLTFRFDEV